MAMDTAMVYGYGADENDQKNGIISKIIRFLKSNK